MHPICSSFKGHFKRKLQERGAGGKGGEGHKKEKGLWRVPSNSCPVRSSNHFQALLHREATLKKNTFFLGHCPKGGRVQIHLKCFQVGVWISAERKLGEPTNKRDQVNKKKSIYFSPWILDIWFYWHRYKILSRFCIKLFRKK